MKMKHVIGALAICMVAATAAQAGIATWVKFDQVKPGQGITLPTGGTTAGVYMLSIDPSPTPTAGSSTPGGTATPSFCVDVNGFAQTTWQLYSLDTLEDHLSGVKAKDLRQLLRIAYPSPSTAWNSVNDLYAASVEAAVWEIVNETTKPYSLSTTDGGNWWATGFDMSTANGWLTTINGDDTLPEYQNVKILYSAQFQDFAIVSTKSDPVPEPLTMASAFFAIGGLGAYIRRRTGRAAA